MDFLNVEKDRSTTRRTGDFCCLRASLHNASQAVRQLMLNITPHILPLLVATLDGAKLQHTPHHAMATATLLSGTPITIDTTDTLMRVSHTLLPYDSGIS